MEARGAAIGQPAAGRAVRQAGGRGGPRYGEKAIKVLLAACALISVVTTTAIVDLAADPGDRVLRRGPVGRLLLRDGLGARFEPASFGVLPIVVGTLSVTLWGLLFAIPIGLGIGDLPERVRQPEGAQDGQADPRGPRRDPDGRLRLLRRRSSSRRCSRTSGRNFLGGAPASSTPWPPASAIGLLIVPIIASISEDAMTAVPAGLREGAYALGATKMRRSRRGSSSRRRSRGSSPRSCSRVSRAVGETMVVLLAAGNTPNLTFNPVEVGAGDDRLHRRHGDRRHRHRARSTTRRSSQSAPCCSLMTLLMNLLSIRLVRKYREVYE